MKESIIKISISLVILIICLVFPLQNIWIKQGLYIISYLIVGLEIILKAVKNIFKGEFLDENFLMAIATIGAICIGEFPEAIAVMLFYEIGETLQDYAVDKSRKSITDLMNIKPEFANVKRDGKLEKVNPNDVKIGEEIVIKPGEKVPLDGVVIDGVSSLDMKALTGEALPKTVKIDDEILSGSVNQSGVLTVRVTKEYGESTVSKILKLVENASSKKSKSEKFITKFAKYYTPIVVGIAILLAIVPYFVFHIGTFNEWLYRALTFLVVSCPCALVISIPLGFFSGIGRNAKSGIMVKGSTYIEALSKAKIVVLDKTGTLTKGSFEVVKIEPIDIEKEELLKLVAHAESFSNHPISVSIQKAYKEICEEQIDSKIVNDVKELAGKGIEATINNKQLIIGNEKLMKEKNIAFSECNEIGTFLYVAINNKYSGYIVIADIVKEDAKEAIKSLKQNDVKKIVMLTGDSKKVAEPIAKELNIDEVYSELLPDGKVEKVEELIKNKSENEKLIFAGDGINDAPVLAMSDVGVAMGFGSDAAIEAADVILMTDEPSKISTSIKISKRTMKKIKQNIVFAICVKLAVLILTAFGLSSMWAAVFADVGVTILAILNVAI